jgi:hypothetical protein
MQLCSAVVLAAVVANNSFLFARLCGGRSLVVGALAGAGWCLQAGERNVGANLSLVAHGDM